MKSFSIRKSLYLCVMLAAVISSSIGLTSCDDESEPKDTTAPEVSFSNLTANQEVWNTVIISLEASDDKGIASIDVFVDGNLVTTVTEAPFEISWDSNTVPDGSHTVKVVATDKAGNTVEKEVVILVKNVLVSIDLAADQLLSEAGYTERGFVFLSDADGKVITSAEYTNGQRLELKSPTFNGDKFYLTEVLLEVDDVDGNSVRLWTFTDIERGKWVVIDDREEDETYAGSATLNFINAGSQLFYGARSNGDEAGADASNTSSVIRIKKSPSKLYVTSNNETGTLVPKFNLYSNIVVGTNTIDLSFVNKSLTKVTATVPAGAFYGVVEVSGYPVANNYTEPYDVGYFGANQGTFDIYYPGTAFPSYSIEHYYETSEIYYIRGSRSEFGNFSSLQHTENFSFANNKLTYSASGNYDVVSATFNTDESAYWTLILPTGSNISVPKLELPSALNGFNIPAIGMPSYYGINEFENISTYSDIRTLIRNSTGSIDQLLSAGKNYTTMIFFTVPSGGRTKPQPSHFLLGTKIRKRR